MSPAFAAGTITSLPLAPAFSDIPSNTWFAPYAQAVSLAGFMSGYKDASGELLGRFGPAEPLTYGELAKIAVVVSPGNSLLSSAGTGVPPAAPTSLYRVRTLALNLRADARTTSGIRTTLGQGDTVTVLRFVHDHQWAEVLRPDGTHGFVLASSLDAVMPVDPHVPRNLSARGDWSAPFVAAAEKLGLTVFTPELDVNSPATRGAVVLTLLQALHISTQRHVNASYTDLRPTDVYADPIIAATRLGWIHGDTDPQGRPLGTVRPRGQINRAELAKILSIALALSAPGSVSTTTARSVNSAAASATAPYPSGRPHGGGGGGRTAAGSNGNGTSSSSTASSTAAAPTGNAGGNRTINEGIPITLTGSATGGQAPLTYHWDFGDGTSSGVLQPMHRYDKHGSYTATLTITDALTRTFASSATITVNDVAPTPDAHGPYSGYSGSSISFTGTATDPSNADTASGFTLSWTFGDGGSASGASVTHIYTATGAYTVTLKATEASGLHTSVTTTAAITEPAGAPVASAGTNKQYLGLVGYWTFDEGAGSAANDSSGHANNGTLISSPTWSTSVPSTMQFPDTHSLSFNGANYVQVPDGSSLDVAGPFAVSQFLKSTSTADWSVPISKSLWYIQKDGTNNDVHFYVSGVGATQNAGTTVFNDGLWHHLVAQWTGQNLELWVDGTRTQQAAKSGTPDVGTYTLTVGSEHTSAYFSGNVDDVRIYNRALTGSEIANLATGAQFASTSGYAANEGSLFTFTGSVTGGQAPLTYHWDFGDGTSSGSLVAVHTYPGVGPYTATFTVTDALNRTSTASTLVTITNLAPSPNSHGPYTVTATGSNISFTGTATDPGHDDTVAGFTYSWYFGDGASASGANVTHAYTATGTYTVTLSARDQEGLAASTTTTATVGGPRVSAGTNRTINEGTPITLTGSVSGGHSPYTYLWTFGDGNTSTSLQPAHTFDKHGTYAVTFKATDANSVSAQSGVTITVRDLPPTPNAYGPYQVGTGVILTFSGSVTDPSSSDTASGFILTWNFGDGATGTGATPSHTYTGSGHYTVTLVAKEKSGLTGTASTTVTVGPVVTGPQVLLTPGVLTALRQKVTGNTSQWQAFKTRLANNIGIVNASNDGSYQGSSLSWISDYALGYKILENSDPTTAHNYADKAIGLIKSAINDYQKGSWTARQYLTRGDGTTKAFTLPNADYLPSSVHIYLSPVTTKAVVHGASHGQDSVDYYTTFLQVSNSSGSSANYTKGIDWRRNGDYADNEIDWSLGRSEPAVGATYYVAEASLTSALLTAAYTLSGTTLAFSTAPTANQAIFIEYVYGTHSSDYSTLAYQETSAGDGGFNSVYVDANYSARYLMHVAIGFDWLYDYPGFSVSLKSQVATMLVRWSDYARQYGYKNAYPQSNYGDGEYAERVMTALALSGYRDSAASRLRGEVTSWRTENVLPALTNTGTSLYGGFWAEGWSYGGPAATNLLLAEVASHSGALTSSIAADQAWAAQVMTNLLSIQPTQTTMYDGGDWYAYPASFVSKDLIAMLGATATGATVKEYANYVLKNYAGSVSNNYLDLIFRDPTATTRSWTGALALQSYAQGTGLVSCRANWSYASTWFTFQLGNLLPVDHQTYTPGQVQVQRGADDLLVNPNAVGGNQGPSIESSYGNLVLLDDNGDGAQDYRFALGLTYGTPGVVINDYEASGSYVYSGGDYKAAYSLNTNPGGGGSASRLTRQVVYLRPDNIIVHDRVGTIKASYPKLLQWHFLNPPTVSGSTWTEAVGSSKLFGATFSSGALTTTMTGSLKVGTATVARIRTTFGYATQSGSFTTALQSTPSTTSTMVSTSRIASTDGRMEGVQMGTGVVLFGTNAALSPFTGSVTYTINGTGTYSHLLVDLEPGRTYTVTVGGLTIATKVASSQGTIQFTSTPVGSQTLLVQ